MNNDQHLLSQIQGIMRRIREATPRYVEAEWQYPSASFLRYDYLNGRKVNTASITLLPSGCRHAAQGGCTMCGEWSGSNLGELVAAEFHVAQFAAASSRLLSESNIHWLHIYQEGSFLNEEEVAPEAQEVILQLASNFRSVERITIESRPEYLRDTEASLARANTRESVELEVGIGLETKDDFVRNICIGKGTSKAAYERAVEVCHRNNIIPLAYVLLKPPFLSEEEAIEETFESVEYAFALGFEEVHIQPASIHAWSLSELLMNEGLYSPPWLWSVIEVAKQAAHLGKLKIGGFEYFPAPSKIAFNRQSINNQQPCECNHKIWKLIYEYNATHNIDLITRSTCSCKSAWRTSLTQNRTPLSSRVAETLSTISLESYLQIKRNLSDSSS